MKITITGIDEKVAKVANMLRSFRGISIEVEHDENVENVGGDSEEFEFKPEEAEKPAPKKGKKK